MKRKNEERSFKQDLWRNTNYPLNGKITQDT